MPQECLDDLEGFAERGGMVPFIEERTREHARRLDAEHALGTRSPDRMPRFALRCSGSSRRPLDRA